MSSERFESLEFDVQEAIAQIKTICAQLSNYTGEQQRAAQGKATKVLEEAEDLMYDMEEEVRNAPPTVRTNMNSRVTGYKNELLNLKRNIANAKNRGSLLGSGSSQVDTRSQLLQNRSTQDRTTERMRNTQRLAHESEAIGEQVVLDLHDQRQTIVRSANKITGVDANLSRSNRILNGMTRRIMTNKIIMISIIAMLFGILGITIYLKLKK